MPVTSASVEPDDELEPMSFGRRTARVLAIAVVVLIVALWSYALFWPHTTTIPGTLSDPAFAEQAQSVCAATAAELATLPPAYVTPTPAERADVVARSDVMLSSMLDRLAAIEPPADTKDGAMVAEWLADWRTYVGDRESYANALRSDASARFYVSKKDRRQVSEPIDFFATANKMYDCVTPGDLD